MTKLLPSFFATDDVVVASNILVQFLLGPLLTWGAFTYPIAFLVTDVLNRVYGAGPARKVVFAGFVGDCVAEVRPFFWQCRAEEVKNRLGELGSTLINSYPAQQHAG